MRTHYQTAKLDDVLRYFAKDFEPIREGEKIVRTNYFVDQQKNTVVFEMLVHEPSDQ